MRLAPAGFCSVLAVTRSILVPLTLAFRVRSPARLRTNTSPPAEMPVAARLDSPLAEASKPEADTVPIASASTSSNSKSPPAEPARVVAATLLSAFASSTLPPALASRLCAVIAPAAVCTMSPPLLSASVPESSTSTWVGSHENGATGPSK